MRPEKDVRNGTGNIGFNAAAMEAVAQDRQDDSSRQIN
jgi:hypothetical protein